MTASLADPRKYYTGHIGISGNRIVFAGTSAEEAASFARQYGESLKTIDGTGMLAMPGLVNLHNHVSMSLMRSYADDMPLMPWLTEKIWPFEAKLTADDIYLGAKLGIAEMLLGGTTTFADMYWHSERVAQAVLETGIRAMVCPTFVDHRYAKFAEEAVQVLEQYRGKGGGRILVRLAPHAPYTCSPDNIKAALEICRTYDTGIHVHLSETQAEIDTIRERYGKTPVEYLEDLGVFERPTLAAHCIHLTDKDKEILLRHGVSVSHNPQSNMKLSSGVAPVTDMIARGINVGVGTDGPCSNNDLDMWDEIRSASFLQKVSTSDPCSLPAYQVLQMATVNGARAIGMEGELGVIRKGALADVILLDMCKPHLCPSHDPVADLVYCVKSTDVDTVIVNGVPLVERGRLNSIDTSALCREAQKCIEAIARR